jgi:hypothetical protein
MIGGIRVARAASTHSKPSGKRDGTGSTGRSGLFHPSTYSISGNRPARGRNIAVSPMATGRDRGLMSIGPATRPRRLSLCLRKRRRSASRGNHGDLVTATIAGNRSYRPSAQRYSIEKLRPSTYPASLCPRRNGRQSRRFGLRHSRVPASPAQEHAPSP